MSTMLAVVSAIKEVDLGHIDCARQEREKSLAKDLITNGHIASSFGGSFSTIS